MPRERTLRDRLNDVTHSIEVTRRYTAGLDVLSREDLRQAIRALAEALEDLQAVYHVTHIDQLDHPDIPGHHRRIPPPTEN